MKQSNDTARKKEANPNSIYLSKGVQNENCIERRSYGIMFVVGGLFTR